MRLKRERAAPARKRSSDRVLSLIETAMSWLADICLAPMIGYFCWSQSGALLRKCFRPGDWWSAFLQRSAFMPMIGRLMRLLFAQSFHPRLLCLCESALSAVRKLERSTRLPKADVRRAGVDTSRTSKYRYLVSRSPWTGLCGGVNQSNSASPVDLIILSRDYPDVRSRDNLAGAGGAR